jgi:hypothetical protein
VNWCEREHSFLKFQSNSTSRCFVWKVISWLNKEAKERTNVTSTQYSSGFNSFGKVPPFRPSFTATSGNSAEPNSHYAKMYATPKLFSNNTTPSLNQNNDCGIPLHRVTPNPIAPKTPNIHISRCQIPAIDNNDTARRFAPSAIDKNR